MMQVVSIFSSNSRSTFSQMPDCSFKKIWWSEDLRGQKKTLWCTSSCSWCLCPGCQWRVDLRCSEVRTTAPLTHSNYRLTGSGGSPKQADSSLDKVIHWLFLISVIFKQQHYSKLRGNTSWNEKYLYIICIVCPHIVKLGLFPFSVIMDLLPFGSLASCSLTLRPWRLLNQRSEALLCRTLLRSIPPSTRWNRTAHLYLVRNSC